MRMSANGRSFAGLGCSAALAVAMLAVPAAPAAAADGSSDAVLKMLEIMRSKGMLTPQEEQDVLRALSAEQARERAAQEAAIDARVAERVAATEAERAPAKPDYPRVKLTGRIQPRYSYLPSDDGVEGASSFSGRRLRLGAAGAYSENVEFLFQGEYATSDNDVDLLDAQVIFKSLQDSVGQIVIGRGFIPAYINSSARTLAVERNYTQFLGPGQAGRSWGIGLVRGKSYGNRGDGLFGDWLHYWAGVFNGSSGSTTNENNELLYALRLDLMEPGKPMLGDEWDLRGTDFRWNIGGSWAQANEQGGSPDFAFNNLLAPTPIDRIDNQWMGAHAQFQGYGWWGLVQYQRFESEDADGSTPLFNAQGGTRRTLESDAWVLGLSRVMGPGLQPGHQWGLGYQFQTVDNEHPFRTRFMGPRGGFLSGGTGTAFNFNEGDTHNLVLMYAVDPNLRFHLQYDINDEDDPGVPKNNLLTLQGMLNF